MTEERKEELRLLLNEAMENLKIQHNLLGWFGLPSLELDRYRGHLNQTGHLIQRNPHGLWTTIG